MHKYRWLDGDLKKLEKNRPKLEPKLPVHPLISKIAEQPNGRLILEVALGLLEAIPPDWNENGNSILCTRQNSLGIRKQRVFDFLEHRNGEQDDIARKLIIEVLQENDKSTLEAETLLHALHIRLIREVMDVNRPHLRLITANPESILHEEFELDVRFPSQHVDVGPTETRVQPMGPYPTQQELTRRLKEIFKRNCERWRKILERCETDTELA